MHSLDYCFCFFVFYPSVSAGFLWRWCVWEKNQRQSIRDSKADKKRRQTLAHHYRWLSLYQSLALLINKHLWTNVVYTQKVYKPDEHIFYILLICLIIDISSLPWSTCPNRSILNFHTPVSKILFCSVNTAQQREDKFTQGINFEPLLCLSYQRVERPTRDRSCQSSASPWGSAWWVWPAWLFTAGTSELLTYITETRTNRSLL